jgi:hypothetical protein
LLDNVVPGDLRSPLRRAALSIDHPGRFSISQKEITTRIYQLFKKYAATMSLNETVPLQTRRAS